MRFKPWLSLAVLIMLAGAMIVPLRATAAARSPEEVPPTQPPFKARLFPETGHTAVNSFLSFWERTPNALLRHMESHISVTIPIRAGISWEHCGI